MPFLAFQEEKDLEGDAHLQTPCPPTPSCAVPTSDLVVFTVNVCSDLSISLFTTTYLFSLCLRTEVLKHAVYSGSEFHIPSLSPQPDTWHTGERARATKL